MNYTRQTSDICDLTVFNLHSYSLTWSKICVLLNSFPLPGRTGFLSENSVMWNQTGAIRKVFLAIIKARVPREVPKQTSEAEFGLVSPTCLYTHRGFLRCIR